MIPGLRIGELAMGLVIELTSAPGEVPMLSKILGQGHPVLVLRHVTKPVQVAVDAGRRRAEPHHDRGTRRTAQRSGAMGLFEEHAPFGEGIDVRCFGLWMSAEAPDPVVQIINRKKQNIGSFTGMQEETCEA